MNGNRQLRRMSGRAGFRQQVPRPAGRRRTDRALRARPKRHHPAQTRRRRRDPLGHGWRLLPSFTGRTGFVDPPRACPRLPCGPIPAGATTRPTGDTIAPCACRLPRSHERLWRSDHLYDIVVVLDYNLARTDPWRRQRHLSSSIAAPGFSPTEGCVAIPMPAMRRLLAGRRLELRYPRSNGFGQARSPKIALPTLTSVAPKAIAVSKSALMPIDKWHEAGCALRSCEAVRNAAPALRLQAECTSALRFRGRMSRQSATKPVDRIRRNAALLRFLAGIDLHSETRKRLALARRAPWQARAASDGRSSESMTSNRASASRTLLVCSGPIRCSSIPA